MASPAEVHVIAGAISDASGRVLIAQRPRGRHMAGRWEFPGGKLDLGEDAYAGLKRELQEELGVVVREARPLIRLRHAYTDRSVLLDVWQVTAYEGEPQALESQALAWARPDELPKHDLLEADRAIVTALRLPRLARVIATAIELAKIRGSAAQTILWPMPEGGEVALDADMIAAARAVGHRVFVLGPDIDAVRTAAIAGCDGAVLEWNGQSLHVDRSGAFLIGVQCGDIAGARRAVKEGAHFLVAAPEEGPLQAPELEALCDAVGLPVFAGWYPDARRLERVQLAGAHGCAIRR
ncbi:MAG: NUDIX domain-containing protein [Steroidobacteraceae bacterium]